MFIASLSQEFLAVFRTVMTFSQHWNHGDRCQGVMLEGISIYLSDLDHGHQSNIKFPFLKPLVGLFEVFTSRVL
jgi:hypothetical protein